MHRALAAFLVLLLAGSACAPRRTAAPRARLSPDSAAALEKAVRMARPAFATQEEALRSGAYLAAPAGAPPEAPIDLLGVAHPGYVIQIAAYRDRPTAERAARDAGTRFPELEVVIEEGAGHFRVALAGWRSSEEARTALMRVRESYPDAWLRDRAVP